MPSRIEGERIALRYATANDAHAIWNLVEQYPENLERFSFFSLRDKTRGDEVAYLYDMWESPDDALFIIEAIDDQRVFGTCGLHDIDRHNDIARLGYVLFDASIQGRGIMREALELLLNWGFTELGLNRIEGNVFLENIVGQQLDIGLRFRIEGWRRQAYKLNGVYHDVYHFALLKCDWEKQQAAD